MAFPIKPTILFCFLLSLFLPSSAQNCSSYSFLQNRLYSLCNSLPYLGASIHWNYYPSNGTVDIAYRASQPSDGWVAWGINPNSSGMIGTQAIFAFLNSDGFLTVHTTAITSYQPTMIQGNISFPVFVRLAEWTNNVTTIYAMLGLPSNTTIVRTAWQAGTTFANGVPSGHPTTGDNIKSSGTLDFLSGRINVTSIV